MNINKLLKAKNEEDLGFPVQKDGISEKRNESFGLPLSTKKKQKINRTPIPERLGAALAAEMHIYVQQSN